MDVKSAFFSGTLKEDVHVEQPPGVEQNLQAKKNLVGLKQAPRA